MIETIDFSSPMINNPNPSSEFDPNLALSRPYAPEDVASLGRHGRQDVVATHQYPVVDFRNPNTLRVPKFTEIAPYLAAKTVVAGEVAFTAPGEEDQSPAAQRARAGARLQTSRRILSVAAQSDHSRMAVAVVTDDSVAGILRGDHLIANQATGSTEAKTLSREDEELLFGDWSYEEWKRNQPVEEPHAWMENSAKSGRGLTANLKVRIAGAAAMQNEVEGSAQRERHERVKTFGSTLRLAATGVAKAMRAATGKNRRAARRNETVVDQLGGMLESN
jgi:hypothetical protein